MAQDALVGLTANTWTMVSADADVTELAAQNRGGSVIILMGTTGSAPSANARNGWSMKPGDAFAKRTVAELWPGVAVTRVFALSLDVDGLVYVNHA